MVTDYALILLLALLLQPQQANATLWDWWRNACERHLIADDPYQYEHFTNDQVIDELIYYRNHPSTPAMLVREAHRRMSEPMLSGQAEQMRKALLK